MCVSAGQAGDPAEFCVPVGAGSRQVLALASLGHRPSDRELAPALHGGPAREA